MQSMQRQARIKSELDEARRLREEAQALLAEFERKGREAETEAEAIIASAKAEAERLAAEAKTRMEDFVARRTKMAEEKIVQAEAQALADVRSAAADAAVAAAEKILAPPPKARSPKICWRRASKTSEANSIEGACVFGRFHVQDCEVFTFRLSLFYRAQSQSDLISVHNRTLDY